ncbi:MAG: terminase small subunit [bacterium]
MPDNLNPKQKAFCDEYLANGCNATKAYLVAYPDCTYDSARTLAANLLANIGIKKYLDERLKEVDKSNLLSIKEILIKVQGIAGNEKTKVAEKLKSYDLLLKAHGAYKENVININNAPASNVGPEEVKAMIKEIAEETRKKFEIKKNEAEYQAKCKKWGV